MTVQKQLLSLNEEKDITAQQNAALTSQQQHHVEMPVSHHTDKEKLLDDEEKANAPRNTDITTTSHSQDADRHCKVDHQNSGK